MMIGMMCSTIDNWLQHCRHFKVTVMDGHSPDIHSDVQCQVQHLVQWEQECIYMIGHALHEAVDGVKCMTGIRRRHFPRMMGLVYCCVYEAMVEPTMNPIDEAVSEEDEGKDRQYNP